MVWGYGFTSLVEQCFVDWAVMGNLTLLCNPKDAPSFFSDHWNTGGNPHLIFASTGLDNLQLDRLILEKSPTSTIADYGHQKYSPSPK